MQGKKTLFLILGIFCFSFLTHAQTTYYVSSSDGDDDNTGTSAVSAWKTIAKLNKTVFGPGDQILLKKGDTWREQLVISSTGSSSSKIEISSYDIGNDPVITGADPVTGFTQFSGNIWRTQTSASQQVFFSGVRGYPQSSETALNLENEWYWEAGYLYVYSSDEPLNIESSKRSRGITVNGDYIRIEGLTIQKVVGAGIDVSYSSTGVTIDNCNFYQWSNSVNAQIGAVVLNGTSCEVINSFFGKTTGNDLQDQGWAGLVGIVLNGRNNSANNNSIYHSAIENESDAGIYATGIRIRSVSGTTKVYKNYIYHTGSHGISITTNSVAADEIHVYENTIEHPGQAGISSYQTRSSDGVGGKGYIYKNNVSFSNRLGGEIGANGQQSSGIHFNDGLKVNTDPLKPFMKWYCYENVVHDNRSLKVPNSPDACGISMDFNANGVEVFKNLVYNNYSKGIEMWNASDCKIYYNIIYGNDAGINVTCAAGESATNNQIYNNTCYKNYNGNDKGPNLHTEIFFGLRGKDNIIKNNILYASDLGYAYIYNVQQTGGHKLDNNLVYSENGYIARDGQYGKLKFSQWVAKRAGWDANSINADPGFTNPSQGDFTLTSTSPAINKGTDLGFAGDFLGKILNGLPDIGANEFQAPPPPPDPTPDPDPDTTDTHIIIITLDAMTGKFTGDARLGFMTGQLNKRSVFFKGTRGGVSFTANIPVSGKTWYVWARMYYMSSGQKNSFFFNIKGNSYILGDDDTKYDRWHWDGYKGDKLDIGILNKGQNYLSISGREPGLTLWVDKVILTDNADYDPNSAAKGTFDEPGSGEVTEGEAPMQYELTQNYPNPFNPTTAIKYTVPENSHITLKIYDMLGAEVATVIDQMQAPGYYEVEFNASNLASGVYVYQLRGKDFVQTKKMNLLK